VWSCAQTRGYEGLINCTIKKVNGKEINNIRDLISAIETHTGKTHELITSGGTLVVLPKISEEDKIILLGHHGVAPDKDRSFDLQDTRHVVDVTVKPSLAVLKPMPVRATSAQVAKLLSKVNKTEAFDQDELMSDFEGFDESPAPAPIVQKQAKDLKAEDFPGVKRFSETVKRIEQQAKLMEDLDFEDDEIDIESLGEGSESDSPEAVSDASEEKAPAKRSERAGIAFFSSTPANKRKREEDEEDKSRDTKRHRGIQGARQ
jgi:hypothetical protein